MQEDDTDDGKIRRDIGADDKGGNSKPRRRKLPWALMVMICQKLKYDKKKKKNIFKLCLVSRLKKKKDLQSVIM